MGQILHARCRTQISYHNPPAHSASTCTDVSRLRSHVQIPLRALEESTIASRVNLNTHTHTTGVQPTVSNLARGHAQRITFQQVHSTTVFDDSTVYNPLDLAFWGPCATGFIDKRGLHLHHESWHGVVGGVCGFVDGDTTSTRWRSLWVHVQFSPALFISLRILISDLFCVCVRGEYAWACVNLSKLLMEYHTT